MFRLPPLILGRLFVRMSLRGLVAKLVNAAVCKTAMRRFEPGPGLAKTHDLFVGFYIILDKLLALALGCGL